MPRIEQPEIQPEIALFADGLKASFYDFFFTFWSRISSDRYVHSKHIEFICNKLQTIGEAIIARERPEHLWYIFNVPPGTTKSSIISTAWPIWLLTRDPGIFIINNSYSSDLSTRDVRRSKNIFTSDLYRAMFPALEIQKNTESFFETRQGGGRYATSTGGTIVGYHGNVGIHDDPLSVEMSHSPAERARGNRFVTETMSGRVRDKAITPQIILMQRLHEEDPTGYIKDRGLDCEHIILPAELTDYTTHPELYTDGLLDPSRLPKEVIQNKQKELGPVAYSAQYDQNPTSKEGLLYSPFETYTDLPPTVGNGNYTDTADAGTDNLLSVSYRKGKDGKIYVTDLLFTDKPMEDTERYMPMLYRRSETRYSNIESNAGGRYFAIKVRQICTKERIPVQIKWFHQAKNKEARILTNAATVNQLIIFPEDWQERWPDFHKHITLYKRLFRANAKHDGPDVLTGIIETEVFSKTRKKIKRTG